MLTYMLFSEEIVDKSGFVKMPENFNSKINLKLISNNINISKADDDQGLSNGSIPRPFFLADDPFNIIYE